ncbi:MAG: hypothetical protein AAFV93_11585 [Chloroflexota bacterium]
MEKLRHALIVTVRVMIVTIVVSFCSVELPESIFSSMDDNDWAPNFHYSPDANQRIASFIANWLLENIDAIDCDE